MNNLFTALFTATAAVPFKINSTTYIWCDECQDYQSTEDMIMCINCNKMCLSVCKEHATDKQINNWICDCCYI